MKKKHLHGKLSLKIKDLSAMNGQARQVQGGAESDTTGCPQCELTQATCTQPGVNTCATCNGDTSCPGGPCPPTQSCDGNTSCLYCAPTTPERGCDTRDCTNTCPTAVNCASVIICTGADC